MVEDHHADDREIVIPPSRRRRLAAVLLIVAALIGTAALIIYQSPITAEDNQLFYLSVGLYADYTHDCYYHNPATCDAQFKSKPVKYRIRSLDASFEDSGLKTTTDKGWLDFYLPKNQRYLAEFEVEDLRGYGSLSTEDGAPTCISTIKVSR